MAESREAGPPLAEDSNSQALAEPAQQLCHRSRCHVLMVVVFGVRIFTVGAAEKAVILRFGKRWRGQKALLTAGLTGHCPIPSTKSSGYPFGIQKVTSTTGWYFITPEQE